MLAPWTLVVSGAVLVVKAGACLGLRQCDHNSQLHERDVVLSSEEGLLKKTGNIFPESTTAFQKPFSGKCQRKCYVGGDLVQAHSYLRRAEQNPLNATLGFSSGGEFLIHSRMYSLASSLLSAHLKIFP